MRVIIDRFEGDFAVVEMEDMTFADVPKSLFPDAAEGAVYDITRNVTEEKKRATKIRNLFDELTEK